MTIPSLEELGGWVSILGPLTNGHDISADMAQSALTEVLAGESTDAQITALIVSLRQKGETVEELTGLVHAMLGAAVPLVIPDGAIDMVGAGGSKARQKAALNVSTMSSFVAAAAGAVVCKHGNRKASSTSGSFDLLDELGVNTELTPEGVQACVAEVGLAFAYARTFHPAMRFVGPVRSQIGVPTVFNVIGPLSNPALVKHSVVGVADAAVGERMIEVLKATGHERAFVITGDGAIDELATTGPSVVFELRNDEISRSSLDPAELGIAPPPAEGLRGGDCVANAAIARELFDGVKSPERDMITLNAAAGLMVSGVATSWIDGIERAGEALDSGAAGERLEQLIAVSNR